MINVLIFSKNRASQLELLLRSIQDNFKEINQKNTIILFKQTDDNFNKGYNKLVSLYPKIDFIEEYDFVNQTKEIINNFKFNYSVILCDDEVVINNFNIKDSLKYLDENNTLHCLSLRMHPNIVYSYAADLKSPPPDKFNRIKINDDLIGITWNWREYYSLYKKEYADWAYPSCINTHIYKTIFLKRLINQLNFNHVNNLESIIHATKRHLFRPNMMLFEKPKTISIPNNITQTGTNRSGFNEDYSLNALNKKFINNYRISTENLYKLSVDSVHAEIDYLFEKF